MQPPQSPRRRVGNEAAWPRAGSVNVRLSGGLDEEENHPVCVPVATAKRHSEAARVVLKSNSPEQYLPEELDLPEGALAAGRARETPLDGNELSMCKRCADKSGFLWDSCFGRSRKRWVQSAHLPPFLIGIYLACKTPKSAVSEHRSDAGTPPAPGRPYASRCDT